MRTGATGLEPATPGFGDRCATNCATPLGCSAECIGADSGVSGGRSSIAAVPLVALFSLIAAALAAIAVWSAEAGRWPIAVAAAVLAAWMGSLAWAALRKTRV